MAACQPRTKPKRRHGAVTGEIHFETVFVTGLVIVLLVVFLILREPPGFVVALVLHAFADGKRRDAHAREAEMIGAVVVPASG